MSRVPVPVSGKKDSERQVALRVGEILARHFPDCVVETGKNLIYKIEIDTTGQVTHDSGDGPKRGQYAFQTDISLTKNDLPLVVIELKSGTFSSHDIITYSWKASRHKQIYPYLRYGFVVVGLEALGRRFVTHNEGFDFAMAVPNLMQVEDSLVTLIGRQIVSAERMRGLLQTGRIKLRRYEETVEIDA